MKIELSRIIEFTAGEVAKKLFKAYEEMPSGCTCVALVNKKGHEVSNTWGRKDELPEPTVSTSDYDSIPWKEITKEDILRYMRIYDLMLLSEVTKAYYWSLDWDKGRSWTNYCKVIEL